MRRVMRLVLKFVMHNDSVLTCGPLLVCDISCSYGDDCEEYHLVGCDAMSLVVVYRRFGGSKLSLSSGWDAKPMEEAAYCSILKMKAVRYRKTFNRLHGVTSHCFFFFRLLR